MYVSDSAHVHDNECGGAEFWSGGNARTIPVPGSDGKMSAAELARMVVLKEAEAQKWEQRPEVVLEIQRVNNAADCDRANAIMQPTK